MDRINKNEGGIEVAGKLQFTDGEPAPNGVLPSRITARFLNLVMEELATLVERSGQTLNESRVDQILNAVVSLSAYRSYDYIVGEGEGHVPTLEQAVEAATPGSSILVTTDQIFERPLVIDKTDLKISTLPGVNIRGTNDIDGAILKIDAPRITLENLRIGINNPSENSFVLELTNQADSFLISNSRVFGFSFRPFSIGTRPIQQSGLIIES